MTFRFANLDDCALLSELNHQLIRDEGHRNPMTVPQLEQRMRSWLSSEYQAVIFEEASEVLAYALFQEQPQEIYLRQLFVVRRRRRQGIGRRVTETLRSKIWPKHKRLTVEVLVSNTAGVAFWRALGYVDYALTLEIMPAETSRRISVLSGETSANNQSEAVLQPTLETARLKLRPLILEDVPAVTRLAGRREIADTTLLIPHPYSEEHARDWINRQAEDRNKGKGVVFAIVSRGDLQLVGTIGLRSLDREHSQAEMGFWMGVDFWRRGYTTEAARAVLQYGFETLNLNRIYAHHMLRNPASGRVLEKIGMTKEGVLRERVRKWGIYEDVVTLSLLRRDWQEINSSPGSSPDAVTPSGSSE